MPCIDASLARKTATNVGVKYVKADAIRLDHRCGGCCKHVDYWCSRSALISQVTWGVGFARLPDEFGPRDPIAD
jgi:hypothetical protein